MGKEGAIDHWAAPLKNGAPKFFMSFFVSKKLIKTKGNTAVSSFPKNSLDPAFAGVVN